MNPGSLLTVVETLSNNALAITVGVEVDGAGGDNACEDGTETLEKGTPTFDAVYGEEDVESLAKV